nr:uracil-DNA glycosylase [uncultured Rhodopila sp.]
MDDAFALLRLQLEWGADEAIALEPLDRMRAAEVHPEPVLRAVPPAAQPAAPVGTAAERAVGLAGGAATLEALRAALAGFDGCALRDTASNLVFAEGDTSSTTLIVGEPPGREEDRSGHPFAGPEGALLDQMLASIGLTRSALMLTPLVPWRPPGGRPVSAAELAVCLPFLHRLIGLLQPRRLVIFGGTATRVLLTPNAVRRRPARGWTEARIPGLAQTLPALALPGMTEMLKTPPTRRDAWAGLRLLRRALEEELTQT